MARSPYIQKLRQHLGKSSFIYPGARIIIENDQQEFLAIDRLDTGGLGLPAGGIEEGETIEACIRREVLEETGLELQAVQVIGISSNPALESVEYPNGDQVQYFTIEFYANAWTGTFRVQTSEEVRRPRFVPWERQNELPPNERSIFESLTYFREICSFRLR